MWFISYRVIKKVDGRTDGQVKNILNFTTSKKKNNSGLYFEELNTILHFQPDPSCGSLVIASEKNVTDGWTDGRVKNIYASNLLGGGLIKQILQICVYGLYGRWFVQ